MPLVFVSGAGAEARNSIGIVLVTGMAISTLFTLLFVPSIYLLLAGEHKAKAHAAGEEAGYSGQSLSPAMAAAGVR
jgi:multidrug efflux pump